MHTFVVIIIALCYITLMAFSGRAHGAGTKNADGTPTGWPSWGRVFSMVITGMSVAVVYSYIHTEINYYSLLSGALAICVLNAGHGRFYNMQGANLADPKVEKIEYLVKPVFYLLKKPINTPNYSIACMAVKGFGIAAMIPMLGAILAIVWPAAYLYSFKKTNDSPLAEYIVLGSLGLLVVLILTLV